MIFPSDEEWRSIPTLPTTVFRPLQQRFLKIPQSPLCYWLRPRFFELLAGRTLGEVADVVQGLATADDPRFVRFVWETPPEQFGLPVRSRRWVPFEKGGGYGKWYGHHWWTVDWEHNGARLKAFPASVIRNEQYYFREGWTFSVATRGAFGIRTLTADKIFGHKSMGLHNGAVSLAILANSRVSTYLIRSLSASFGFEAGHVSRLPLWNNGCASLVPFCVSLKRAIVAEVITEQTFHVETIQVKKHSLQPEGIAAILSAAEGYAETVMFNSCDLSPDDIADVFYETGTPAGWFPLISGFEQLPTIPDGLPEVPPEVLDHLGHQERLTLSPKKLADLRSRLRSLYEAGPGASPEEDGVAENDGDEEEEPPAVGARIPIPAETFLEELSQKLDIHPISVYWLLKEGIEQEGWRCLPEERRLAAERVTVMILRLLGHRWPIQIEAGEEVPGWADKDGIIPLTGGTGEPALLDRLRERIAADYDRDTAVPFERHFAEVTGMTLEHWIETEFFKYQIRLFRKRPIAWQIQSGRYAKRRKPAFACLVCFHKLDRDLLAKIRAQYVGPLKQKWETELRSIEEVPERSRSERQDARRVELEELIAELKDFDGRLKEVMDNGFASARLNELAAKERPDQWCSIDGEAPPPADGDALLFQERRYLPDINDGVRVNIAPLQKAGLLAAEVLAKKDVEAAVGDRAEWRSDERRWCREGKLPHPGWWKKGAADGRR